MLDAQYLTIMNQRRLEAEHARRPVIKLEDVENDQGRLNQMSGGWANVTSKMGGKMVVSPVLFARTLRLFLDRLGLGLEWGAR
jgi:transcription initiation factor TFIIF subunit beta